MSRKSFLTLLTVLLASCSRDLDCITNEDITERWFELSSSVLSFDNCYLLTKDGMVLEKTQETLWTAGEWFVIDHCDDCLFEIGSEDTTIELLEEEGECITVNYDGMEAEICDCPY